MEVPSLSQLKLLLNDDHVFRDYFNVFLNLPIFSRRVKYDAETESFDIYPRLQPSHKSVSDEDVMSWLHAHRLPLFWNSHLLHEYALCLELSNGRDGSDNGSCGVSGVKEMGQFRYFLSGTEGEAVCQFWLDVQLLLHAGEDVGNTHDMAQFIDHIRRYYISNGAPCSLSQELKNKLTKEFCYLNHHTTSAGSDLYSSLHSRQVQVLVEAQGQAIVHLRGYWFKMYENSKGSEPEGTAKEERQSSSLPVIVGDRRKTEFHTLLKKSTVTLPHIHRREVKKHHLSAAEERLARVAPLATKPLFTPSTTTLFPLSSSPQHPTPLKMTSGFPRLAPFLTGSLRADFLSGSPLLSHIHQKKKNSTLSANYLLFWWSAELLFTLDEIKRSKKTVGNQLKHWGSPYSNKLIPTATNPNELVKLFLMEGSPHLIELPPHTREELVQLLPRGLGQSLLLTVQEYAAQQLLVPWREFLAHDNNIFMKHCKLMGGRRSRTLQSPDDDDTIEGVYYGDECSLEDMWEALRLVEIAWCPATASLPSRAKPTDKYLPHETSQRNVKTSSSFVRLTDLTGISLDSPLATVSNTMKRSYERSVNTILLVTTPPQHYSGKHCSNQQKTKKKSIPRSLKEIVKDCEQLKQFWEFLAAQGRGCETQLLFWLAMEDLRETQAHSRASPRKMERIIQHFLQNSDTKKFLQCPESLVDSESGQTLAELLAFQSVVGEMVERRWFGHYIASLTVEESHSKEEEECGETEQSLSRKTSVCIEHTRNLWRAFAHGVVSFRRGLMDLETAEDFKSYLREEVVRGSSGSHKKMVGTKVVYVTKLLNDLSFWAEVERYKDIADAVRAAKRGRSHTQEDDIMVYKKAHAIINCFIDSAVVPRVQINIPNELVHHILDCASQGQISRGLFHEAALSIFSILVVYWRKYLTIHHSRKKAEGGAHSAPHSQPHPLSPPNYHTQQLPRLQKVATFDLYPSTNLIDVGPTLAFSLAEGLHWVSSSHLRQQQFELAPPSSSTHLRSTRQDGAGIKSHTSRRMSTRFQTITTAAAVTGRGGNSGIMKSQASLLPATTPPNLSNTTIKN